MKLIKLTRRTGSPIYVSPLRVVSVFENQEQSGETVVVLPEAVYVVTEPPAEVVCLINKELEG